MKAIGGFFELEVGPRRGAYHPTALALCSGRACLARILDEVRPAHAYVPFFVCDSALQPFDRRGVARTFYPLSATLDPILPDELTTGSCVLVVNYFGLKQDAAASVMARGSGDVVVDDTQAFFAQGYDAAWSFNSARKFFGVPDGGYAYGAGLAPGERHPAATGLRYDHLINRLIGRQDLAFQQFQESESLVCADVCAISELSARLLSAVDYFDVRARRLENFAHAHRVLGRANRLTLTLTPSADRGDVPFCYPLLPERRIDREQLARQGLFVPMLWPDVCRRGGDGFVFERDLASRLLPLPIDHRYGADEIEWMCRVVSAAL